MKTFIFTIQTLGKLQSWMSSAENRKKRTCERAQVIQGRMGENEIWLNRVEEQIKEASKTDSIPQVRYLIESSIANNNEFFRAHPMVLKDMSL